MELRFHKSQRLDAMESHQLELRSFNAKQGFGFIENPEAYAMFGRPPVHLHILLVAHGGAF